MGEVGRKAAWLPDGRTLAMPDGPNARVLLVDSTRRYPSLAESPGMDAMDNRRAVMTSVSVSPDGRWLAVGGLRQRGVFVWDLGRRRLDRVLRVTDAKAVTSFVRFSPDGRWLAASTSDPADMACDLWEAGTWRIARRIAGVGRANHAAPPLFAPDGRQPGAPDRADQALRWSTPRPAARAVACRPRHPPIPPRSRPVKTPRRFIRPRDGRPCGSGTSEGSARGSTGSGLIGTRPARPPLPGRPAPPSGPSASRASRRSPGPAARRKCRGRASARVRPP